MGMVKKFQAILDKSRRQIEETGGIPHDVFWREIEAESRPQTSTGKQGRRRTSIWSLKSIGRTLSGDRFHQFFSPGTCLITSVFSGRGASRPGRDGAVGFIARVGLGGPPPAVHAAAPNIYRRVSTAGPTSASQLRRGAGRRCLSPGRTAAALPPCRPARHSKFMRSSPVASQSARLTRTKSGAR
jgi:hypothetical protein